MTHCMRTHNFFCLVALFMATACDGTPVQTLDAGTPDAGQPPTPPDAGPPPAPDAGVPDSGEMLTECMPALQAQQNQAAVLALDLFTVIATGGTGAYRFELITNESGAIINEFSGAYLSGDAEGSKDVVRVTDEGCLGEARVEIEVIYTLKVQPSEVTAPPGTAWQFATVGGSGDFQFAMLLAGSGGTVSEIGAYVAGRTEGEDLVEVTDKISGQTAEATIQVVAGSTLSPIPSMVFVATGQDFELQFQGGSGFVEVVETVSAFELRDGRMVHGLSRGREVVTLRDRFTEQTSSLVVQVQDGQQFTPTRFGDGLFQSRILAPGDLNGDGMPDALLATPEADITAVNDGAVYVYAGNATGLDAAPVQILSGRDRRDEFGRAVVTGDFNQDGEMDIAVGAPRADASGADVGMVRIHYGIGGGFFEPQAAQTLTGRFAGDLFGWSLTACDFNDDGFLDIAVGVFNGEDRDQSPVRFNQGGIQIFNGHDSGFPDTASRSLWGDVPDGSGGWMGVSNMHHGISLASGDIDGDGVCDLAAGTHEYDRPGNSNTGLVYVYRGVADAGDTQGGLQLRPVRGWTSQDPVDIGGQLGRNLAVADLDGDDRAEVIISHHLNDIGSSDSHGAVRVFRGAVFGAEISEMAPVAPADFEIVHDGGGDQVGFMPVVADATGDGLADLLIGSLADEISGGLRDAGTIRIYAGVEGALPDSSAPTRVIAGAAVSDRLGSTFAVMGDLDGDSAPEILGFAHYADRLGPEVGEPLLIYGDETKPRLQLDMGSDPAGMRFGWAAAIVGDISGDGFEDLVVGAPESGVLGLGRLTGEGYLYLGSASGFSNTPDVVLSGMRRHGYGDRFGYGVSSAGDFDGDGAPDYAVVSRFEDQARNPGNSYVLEASCQGSRNDVGAVYVFRGSTTGTPNPQPAFIYYGLTPGDGLKDVEGGFDYDGDGLDDFIVGTPDLDRPGTGNMGGFALVRGRPADDQGRTILVCAPDFRFEGLRANDQVGYQVAAIGDINGDGCDEVAAGAPFEDPTTSNEGAVRIIFGWGGAGCPANPEMIVLRSGVRNAQAGRALRGGGDVDGDGIPDLAVGLPGFAQNGNTVGAATVVYGAYIAGLAREPAQFATAPQNYALLFDPGRPPSVATGTDPGEEFGRGVALLAVGGSVGTVLIAGSPSGTLSGVVRSGAAQAFAWSSPGGITPYPLAGFAGEADRPGGRLGEFVRGGQLNGRPILLVGGYDGSSVTRDGGSLYVFDMTQP